MTWVVIVFFLFAGHQSAPWVHGCPDQACVDEIVAKAKDNPAVYRYVVIRSNQSWVLGMPVPAGAFDRWKS